MRKHEINLYDHSESNSDKDSKILEVEESSKSKIKTSTIKQKESTIKTKHVFMNTILQNDLTNTMINENI